MADTTNNRLDRIEEKLDKLADIVVSIARAEEKIASMQDFQHNQIERVNRLSVKLDDIEKKVDENHRTVCLINKLVYAALIAAVGAYVAQFIQEKEMFGNNPFTSGATQNMVQEKADDDTVRMMKDNPKMMKKGGPGGLKSLNKDAQKDVKKAMKDNVQERTESDCKGMVCKSCGDTYGKPTNEKCMYDSKDPNGKNWMTSKNEAMDPVNKAELKGKHKDRKDKDIDNDGDVDSSDKYLHKRRKAISKAMKDEGYYKDLEIKKQDKELGAKPVLGKKKKPGENAVMNPKLDSGKSKGSEMEQKESVNVSHIRQALMSVLEGENHSPNKDKAEKPEDALKGAGAKKMKDDNKDDGRYHDMEKQSHDDAAKAGRRRTQ